MAFSRKRTGQPDEDAPLFGADVPEALAEPELAPSRPDDVPDTVPTAERSPNLGIEAELRSLRSLFEERLRYDEAREAHFSKLYEELESYKRNEAGEQMLTLARSVLLVIDKVTETQADEHVSDIADELGECLTTVGIEAIETPPDVAGPPEQQVVGFLPDDHPTHVRVVAEGYRYQGRVVRARRVTVKRTPGSERPARDS